MASDLVIIRFKECKDAEKLLEFLSRDNPGLLSDDTDGDLIVWSREPIMISKWRFSSALRMKTEKPGLLLSPTLSELKQ